MQANQDKQPGSSSAGVTVSVSASHVFSSNNSDVRSSGANSSIKSGGQQHKRTGSGPQIRPSKHFVFDYKPLTADQQDDNDEATDIPPSDVAASSTHATHQLGSSNSGFTSALRRSLSPSPRLYPSRCQQFPSLSSKAEGVPSPGTGFLLKAKTVLGKKLVGQQYQHSDPSDMTSRDLLSISRISSAKNPSRASVADKNTAAATPIVDNAGEGTSGDRGRSMFENHGKKTSQKNDAAFSGTRTAQHAAADANNIVEYGDDEDDISSPYNADEIQTHVMPHGPAPEKDLQHLFDAPLQHRVPVDESEARKLERDLKNLMDAFETGHGDPFGLENDPVVKTMHELREKQEYITTQMFALDHTEYWNAENRFGMQKMKGRLNDMISAVDDLCHSLQQLPSHEEFDIQLARNRPAAQRSRKNEPCYDTGDDMVDNTLQTGIDGEISSPDISDVDQALAPDDTGGITFKIPSVPRASSSRVKSKEAGVRNANPLAPASVAASSRPSHKRSVSHPDHPKAVLANAMANPNSESATLTASTSGLPQFGIPQAPPRSARRVKPVLPTDAGDMPGGGTTNDANFQGGGDHTRSAIAGSRSQSLRLPSVTRVPVESTSAVQNVSDDDISSSIATVVYRDATTERGDKSRAGPKVTGKLPAGFELSERSVSPLHSPSTESFQSVHSP